MSDDRPFDRLRAARSTFRQAQGSQIADLSPSAYRPAPSVELEIGELVLHGFAPVDRHRIGEVVERELARLLGERAVPGQNVHPAELTRLDGGAFELAADASAETIGTQIARALYACIGNL